MSERMIPVKGKEFSESTIAGALEKQCSVVFKPNCYVIDCHGTSNGYQIKVQGSGNMGYWIETMHLGQGVDICITTKKLVEIRNRINDLLGD